MDNIWGACIGESLCHVSHEEHLFALNYIKRCWLPLLSQWVPLNSTILYYIMLLLTQYYCHHLMFPRPNHCDSIGYRTRHDFSWLALYGLEIVLHALTTNRLLAKYSISLSSTAKPIILYSSPTDLQRHHNWATTHQLSIKVQTQPDRTGAYQVDFWLHPIESQPIRSFCVSRE